MTCLRCLARQAAPRGLGICSSKLRPALCIFPSMAPTAAHCAAVGCVTDTPDRRVAMQAGLPFSSPSNRL